MALRAKDKRNTLTGSQARAAVARKLHTVKVLFDWQN